jgi:hypothetical protein
LWWTFREEGQNAAAPSITKKYQPSVGKAPALRCSCGGLFFACAQGLTREGLFIMTETASRLAVRLTAFQQDDLQNIIAHLRREVPALEITVSSAVRYAIAQTAQALRAKSPA